MIDFFLHIGTLILIYAVLAVSLNIALGFTGMMNLAHIGFFGVGAYASAILTKGGMHFLLAFALAGGASLLAGVIVTLVTNRLKGDYFALATLGFGFVAYSLMLNWTSLTRGPLGIAGIPRPEIVGFVFKTNVHFFVLALVMCAFSIWTMYRIGSSRYGRLLEAVRDDAIGLSRLGKSVGRLKMEAMAVSALFAGFAGSLLAHYIRFIDPSTFYLADIIMVLTIVIIGGLASIRGSIVAAVIIIVIPEMLRFIGLPTSIVGPMRQVLYALLLIVILLWRPRGMFGKVDLV